MYALSCKGKLTGRGDILVKHGSQLATGLENIHGGQCGTDDHPDDVGLPKQEGDNSTLSYTMSICFGVQAVWTYEAGREIAALLHAQVGGENKQGGPGVCVVQEVEEGQDGKAGEGKRIEAARGGRCGRVVDLDKLGKNGINCGSEYEIGRAQGEGAARPPREGGQDATGQIPILSEQAIEPDGSIHLQAGWGGYHGVPDVKVVSAVVLCLRDMEDLILAMTW